MLGITNKDLSKEVKKALDSGSWSVARSKGHLVLRHTSGASLTCSKTPRCNHASKNFAADVRRIERNAQ